MILSLMINHKLSKYNSNLLLSIAMAFRGGGHGRASQARGRAARAQGHAGGRAGERGKGSQGRGGEKQPTNLFKCLIDEYFRDIDLICNSHSRGEADAPIVKENAFTRETLDEMLLNEEFEFSDWEKDLIVNMMKNENYFLISEETMKKLDAGFRELVPRPRNNDDFAELLHKYYILQADFTDNDKTIDQRKRRQWDVIQRYMDADANGRVSLTEYRFFHIKMAVMYGCEAPSRTGAPKFSFSPPVLHDLQARSNNKRRRTAYLGGDFTNFIGYADPKSPQVSSSEGFKIHMEQLVLAWNAALKQELENAYDGVEILNKRNP
jgi:hypothetical protein